MAHVLTLSITLFFIILYVLLQKKPREVYCKALSDAQFKDKSHNYVREMPIPSKSCTIDDKKLKRRIKFIRFILNQKKYKGIFCDFCDNENILQTLLKADFSELCNLLSVDNKPRVVLLAEFTLKHTDYIFTQDRFLTLCNEQNRVHTLSFNEILHFKEAFLYALLEKTVYIYVNMYTIAKTMRLAKNYVNGGGNISLDKKYKSYSKSKLFLELCALQGGYAQKTDNSVLQSILDEKYNEFARVMQSCQSVLAFDFSRYYTPLEILDKYSTFSNATIAQKQNFLSLLSTLSDKENLDEFMYTIRLEKYIATCSATYTRLKRVEILGRRICILSRKRDISMLSAALSSDLYMKLFFDKKPSRNSNSVLKFVDFENTFEPVYKFNNLNFGISTLGGVLKVNPHLPKEIVSADVTFFNNGTNHTLHVVRSNTSGIFLGDTEIKGTHYIRLGEKPLEVTVKIGN